MNRLWRAQRGCVISAYSWTALKIGLLNDGGQRLLGQLSCTECRRQGLLHKRARAHHFASHRAFKVALRFAAKPWRAIADERRTPFARYGAMKARLPKGLLPPGCAAAWDTAKTRACAIDALQKILRR